MLTPAEALATILDNIASIGEIEQLPVGDAAQRILARDVHSDLDLPPFAKSAMDGYAVRRADFEKRDSARLRVLGESSAGRPFDAPIGTGECVAIYTGAVLPVDCDAVVMVEQSSREGDFVLLKDQPRERQHVCERGEDLRAGDRVLRAGRLLAPADLSVLASVGCDPVPTWRRPRVCVLTTGDELVPPSRKPGPGQIREGNTLQLAAMARFAGAQVVESGVLPDDLDQLARGFDAALSECDALITTGGVSMGKYDLVGKALERCGVSQVFHKVAIKPGKPVWFGMRGAKPVFGLPGNPVSCLVGHEVFVRPALSKLGGRSEQEWGDRLRIGRWKGEPTRENARQQNIPVRVEQGADGVESLEAVRWRSSGDIVGITRAQGLAVIPPGEVVQPGALVNYRPLDGVSA